MPVQNKNINNEKSFNRYIVECKYVRSKGKEFDGFSFNRYIVECKCSYVNKENQKVYSFNRYIVECK